MADALNLHPPACFSHRGGFMPKATPLHVPFWPASPSSGVHAVEAYSIIFPGRGHVPGVVVLAYLLLTVVRISRLWASGSRR